LHETAAAPAAEAAEDAEKEIRMCRSRDGPGRARRLRLCSAPSATAAFMLPGNGLTTVPAKYRAP